MRVKDRVNVKDIINEMEETELEALYCYFQNDNKNISSLFALLCFGKSLGVLELGIPSVINPAATFAYSIVHVITGWLFNINSMILRKKIKSNCSKTQVLDSEVDEIIEKHFSDREEDGIEEKRFGNVKSMYDLPITTIAMLWMNIIRKVNKQGKTKKLNC